MLTLKLDALKCIQSPVPTRAAAFLLMEGVESHRERSNSTNWIPTATEIFPILRNSMRLQNTHKTLTVILSAPFVHALHQSWADFRCMGSLGYLNPSAGGRCKRVAQAACLHVKEQGAHAQLRNLWSIPELVSQIFWNEFPLLSNSLQAFFFSNLIFFHGVEGGF